MLLVVKLFENLILIDEIGVIEASDGSRTFILRGT